MSLNFFKYIFVAEYAHTYAKGCLKASLFLCPLLFVHAAADRRGAGSEGVIYDIDGIADIE